MNTINASAEKAAQYLNIDMESKDKISWMFIILQAYIVEKGDKVLHLFEIYNEAVIALNEDELILKGELKEATVCLMSLQKKLQDAIDLVAADMKKQVTQLDEEDALAAESNLHSGAGSQ